MSPLLVVLGWLGMVPVLMVAASATLFGAGLPLVLLAGVYGRFTEEASRRARATSPSGGANAQGDWSAA